MAVKETVILKCVKKWDSFYLYDEECIQKNINQLKAAFPQVEFLYSVKCNANSHVLRSIWGRGFGADAASAGEVEMAHQFGLPVNQIYYSAPGKAIRDIERSIDKAVLIADSLDEMKRIHRVAESSGRMVKIGIRINPEFTFLGEVGKPSKFGIDEKDAAAFVQSGIYKNIKITGIHVHLKSQELNAKVLAAYYEKVLQLARKFDSICGGLEFVNMGSGIGIPYAPTDLPLDMSVLCRELQNSLRQFQTLCPKMKIMMETGRYVVGKSGIYVTTVMDRKVSFGKTYLVLNNTLNGFIRPSLARLVARCSPDKAPEGAEPLFTSKDAFAFLTLKHEELSEEVTLVGNLCTAMDVIAEDIMMPHLECGDLVVITNAGSYAAVLSPFQFSSQEQPKELFLTQEGEVRCSECT